jgi:hypothetical protein
VVLHDQPIFVITGFHLPKNEAPKYLRLPYVTFNDIDLIRGITTRIYHIFGSHTLRTYNIAANGEIVLELIKKGDLMKTPIIFLILIGCYFLLQLYILPKLGIQT